MADPLAILRKQKLWSLDPFLSIVIFEEVGIYKIPKSDSTRFLTLVVPAEAESSTLSKEKSESEIGSQAFADVVISTSVPLH
jgi:hypothetical protein